MRGFRWAKLFPRFGSILYIYAVLRASLSNKYNLYEVHGHTILQFSCKLTRLVPSLQVNSPPKVIGRPINLQGISVSGRSWLSILGLLFLAEVFTRYLI